MIETVKYISLLMEPNACFIYCFRNANIETVISDFGATNRRTILQFIYIGTFVPKSLLLLGKS